MKKFTKPEIIEIVLARVERWGLRTTAVEVGMDPGYLCAALAGKKPLSDDAAAKLGFDRMETLYTRRAQ